MGLNLFGMEKKGGGTEAENLKCKFEISPPQRERNKNDDDKTQTMLAEKVVWEKESAGKNSFNYNPEKKKVSFPHEKAKNRRAAKQKINLKSSLLMLCIRFNECEMLKLFLCFFFVRT